MEGMYFTYIIKSSKDGKYYYGHTHNIEERILKHNKGRVRSTKARRPFILHYYEEFKTKQEAAKREYFFKTIKGYNYLKEKRII
jgi:putative endonuclease